ncbi:hypothetical protein CP10743SC13_2495 [Chlamydia psittaci 10_743_SC13]|nr:hypothetical protein CP10743SC13_2495 [Chlamydia psittaci 10_743_SC13]
MQTSGIFSLRIRDLTENHTFSLENPPFNPKKSHIFPSKIPHLNKNNAFSL